MTEKILTGMGKWSAEFDENGNCTNAVYDEAYLRLLGQKSGMDTTDSQNEWKAEVHPDDRKIIEENARELFSRHPEGMDYDLEYRMMTSSGYHWFHDYGICTRRPDGSVSRMDGVIFDIQDIVDKQAAQRELTENNLRILPLEDEFEAFYDVELESGRYDVFVKGNTFEENSLTKHSDPSDDFFTATHDTINSIVVPEDRGGLGSLLTREGIRGALTGQDHYDHYYRIILNEKPVWYKIRLVYKNSERTNVVIGVFNAENAIEVKQLVEQHRQLEEALVMAQSAARAKSVFLNNMSHDIRTPMNAIIGYTALAASHIDNREQVQDYLSKIAQSSDHLLCLINDVLDMSRIESGKMSLEEKDENLTDIIRTLRDIVQADIHTKRLDFYIDVDNLHDENIICDRLRLNQALLNILTNAIKFTPAGGMVSMQVREKNSNRSGYGTYEFIVRDTGIGMSRVFLDTIFVPFTRAKSSTASGVQGTGLGMSITKGIIDMMGGQIDIQSEVNQGTRVTVTIDFRLQNMSEIPVPGLNGLRGLVVDSDANACIYVSGLLKEIGLRAEWCTSGREAVFKAGEGKRNGERFLVYVLDGKNPDSNLPDTIREIRGESGEDAAVILLSAGEGSSLDARAAENGATALLTKPVFRSDLIKVLNRWFDNKMTEQKPDTCDFTGKRILVVEDNALNREIATEILSEYGFAIDTAEDGDIAVEKMKAAGKGDYDLILMDIQMPRMDGYEATRQIRALGTEISGIPILAMTANAFEEDRRAAIEAGMNEHIAKPINIEKLKKTLTRFL